MPLGAARLTLLAFQATVAAEAVVIRKKRNFFGVGDAQIDTAQSKFGGSSLYVDGTDYIEHTASGLINTDNNGTLTIEMWVRPAATQAYNGLFDASPSATGGIRQYGAAGNLVAKVQQEANGASTGTWTANTWTHFAVTFDNGAITTYRDGVEEDTGSYTGGIEDKGAFVIGAINRGGAGYFTGHIDEFRISDNIRYTSDFIPQAAPFVNDDNTRCLLHFDGTDGSTYFNDDNGVIPSATADSYSDNLVLALPFDANFGVYDASTFIKGSGTASTISSIGTNPAANSFSKWYGQSFNFTQGDDAISYTLGSSLPSAASGTFVIEGWFRATSTGTNWAISTEDTGGRCIFSISGGAVSFSTSEGNQNFINVGDTTNWHHIALVCDAGTKRVYIDGDYEGAWVSSNTSWSKLSVGQFKNGDANDYDGYIQDLRVYSGTNKGYTGTSGSGDITVPGRMLLTRNGIGWTGAANAPDIDTAQSVFGGSSALFEGASTLKGWGYGEFQKRTGSWTLECWFRVSADSGDATTSICILGSHPSSPATGAGFLFRNFDMKVQWSWNPYNGSDPIQNLLYIAGPTISINTWNHIAMVYDADASTWNLYQNGTRIHSASVTYSDVQHNDNGNVLIGGGASLPQFPGSTANDGWIDEIRWSSTARYSGTSITVPTAPFVNDDSTNFLLHMDGTDGSTLFRDDNGTQGRGNQIVATAKNNAQLSTAQYKFGGASAVFDGVNDIIALGDDTNSDYVLVPRTGEFTWELWVRFDNVSTGSIFLATSIYGAYGDANPTGRSWLGLLYGKPTFAINGGPTISDTTNATADTWYHFAASRDSSNDVRFFLDGTLIGTSNSSATIAAGYVALGGTGNSYDLDFDGYIDELRISNTCRYTASFTPQSEPFQNDANTLALFHFNGANASTTFLDDCGRTQTPLVSDGSAQIDTAQSKFGGSSMVTASSQSEIIVYDATTYMPSRETNTWTVEMWIRPASISGNDIFFDNRSDAVGNGWLIYLANGVPYWYQSNANRTGGGTALSTNTWYHIAVSYDGSNVRLFVDGTQRGSDYANTGVFVVSDDCWIGNNQRFPTNTAGLDGHIDELRVSNIARYTAGFTAPTEPFQNDANTELLIHFDGTDGSTDFIDDNGKESA